MGLGGGRCDHGWGLFYKDRRVWRTLCLRQRRRHAAAGPMLDSILQGVDRSPPSKRWAAVEAPELPYALPVQSGLLIVSV